MLRWLSSKHRRSNSSASGTGSVYTVSLDYLHPAPSAPASTASDSGGGATADGPPNVQRASMSSGVPPDVPRGKGLKNLRRRSLPALHLQEPDNSAGMMSNPPTLILNPLRRRGCCDYQHTQQLHEYRSEMINREQAHARQTSLSIPLEAA